MMKRRERENDLEREIRDHLALEAEEQQEAGLPPQDARFAAQRAFGNVALALEDSRAEWRFAWLGSLAQDLRYALRGFRKSPGFALTVTGTLALGLGTLATAFSMFNATAQLAEQTSEIRVQAANTKIEGGLVTRLLALLLHLVGGLANHLLDA